MAAGVLLLLAALIARMLFGAQREVAAAAVARDPAERALHLRRAMAYYLPGNPWVRQAHDGLLEQARRARRLGDGRTALQSFRELRSAILALRGATRPYAGSLPEINSAIAELTARDPAAAPSLRTAAGQRRHLARLGHPPAPHRGFVLLALLGFGLWVGGGVLLLLRGLKPDLTLVPRRFWPLAGVIGLGLALFCVGLGAA